MKNIQPCNYETYFICDLSVVFVSLQDILYIKHVKTQTMAKILFPFATQKKTQFVLKEVSTASEIAFTNRMISTLIIFRLINWCIPIIPCGTTFELADSLAQIHLCRFFRHQS